MKANIRISNQLKLIEIKRKFIDVNWLEKIRLTDYLQTLFNNYFFRFDEFIAFEFNKINSFRIS